MQGQTGPASKHQGFGTPLTSLSGFSYLTGWPDRSPSGVYGPYTDFVAPLFTVIALVAALDFRLRTGKGQYLDISQNECAMHFLAPIILDFTVNGRVFERRGNRSSRAAPHGIYRCKGEDRWCAIAIYEDEEWIKLCKVTGREEWKEDPRFASQKQRLRHSQDLDLLVEEWTNTKTPEEVMEMLQGEGIAAGVVQNGSDLMKDPQLAHNDAFPNVEHSEMEECVCIRPSVKLTKTAPSSIKPPPLLGEHTEHCCKNLLGMEEEEYVSLLLDGVFE
jgi:benzylsuccinate CoA-transferase BbsF subunit